MYLLDTSALLAHCFSEPGAKEVEDLLASGVTYVAAITWFELRVRLQDSPDTPKVLELYAQSLAGTVDISQEVAQVAFALRQGIGFRIPTADCLIAGAARTRGYQLVHRDAHLGSIPSEWVAQRVLPPKH